MTIRNPGYVLKSTRPAVHKLIAHANELKRDAAAQKMQAYAESVIPGSDAWAYQTDTGAMSMTGIKVPYAVEVDEVPIGWRWDTKAKGGKRILAPAKKTDEGKAIVKTMASFAHKPQALGAVSEVLHISNGTNKWFASATIEVLGEDVYATYFHPLDDESNGARPSDRAKVEADPGWKPCAMSEFYAARERYAPEKAAS